MYVTAVYYIHTPQNLVGLPLKIFSAPALIFFWTPQPPMLISDQHPFQIFFRVGGGGGGGIFFSCLPKIFHDPSVNLTASSQQYYYYPVCNFP